MTVNTSLLNGVKETTLTVTVEEVIKAAVYHRTIIDCVLHQSDFKE